VSAWISNNHGTDVKLISMKGNSGRFLRVAGAVACVYVCTSVLFAFQQSTAKETVAPTPISKPGAKGFNSPQQAADALISAADKFDVAALMQIFGPGGDDIVFSGEYAQDRLHAANFVAEAREKRSISVDPKSHTRAFLLVGNEDWPFPVPLVKAGDKWSFDAKAGRQELLYRRIGANELDAIQICEDYVEAQYDYAFQKREGYDVNQYAQRVVSTAGKQDGLACKKRSLKDEIARQPDGPPKTELQRQMALLERVLERVNEACVMF
jgi:hypothetical protein